MLRLQKWAQQQADDRGSELMERVVQLTMVYFVAKWLAAVRQFVTEEFVRRRAQWLYNVARDYLDNGKIDGSYTSLS